MASKELHPGANAQCPPRLMRAHTFELSTEVFHFYGTATAYTTEELDFYGTSSRLFPQNSYFSEERSQIYKERLQNSKERCSILKITVVFLQNDTTFSSRSVVPCGPP